MSIRRLTRMADPASGDDDEAVVAAFLSYLPSYNAEYNFEAFLGAACAIGRHRPHLLERLLPKAIDAAVCLGADSMDVFWRWAEQIAVRSLEAPPPQVPNFTEETLAFLREGLREHEALVSRLLQERLAEPND
ncbi:MAG: hypothetical protein QOH06_1559 [Acidobacteriota bacterium]|nr:hypothetical protein [Acidobacteriota bacterium]